MYGWTNYSRRWGDSQSIPVPSSDFYCLSSYREDLYESYWASSGSSQESQTSLTLQKRKRNEKRGNESLPPVARKTRQLTVNARERRRMKGLNDAYDKLRKVVLGSDTKHKLSKYATLQIAQTYIAALRDVLQRQDEMCS